MISTNSIVFAILLSSFAIAHSKECAKICTLEYNPICASNGREFRLFGNPCFFEAHQCETNTVWVKSRSLEPCKVQPIALSEPEQVSCEIPCTRELNPICGTDGEHAKLFSNRCVMANEHCHDGKAWFETRASECEPNAISAIDTSCEVPCTRELRPVCGSNGETYKLFNNRCIMENEHCKDGHPWFQTLSNNCFQPKNPVPSEPINENCEVPCTRELNPVCGFDGEHHKLFNNVCLMANEHCNDGHKWLETRMSDCLFRAPTINTKCETPCRKNLVPTCGTDGEHFKMFSNECVMKNEHCHDGHVWRQTRMMDCEAPQETSDSDNGPLSDCPLVCPLIYAPVCGFDGRSYQTFSNSCEMRAKNCMNHSNFKQTRFGECTPEAPVNTVDNGPLSDCPSVCPYIYAPVCGFDGKSYQTFSNSCEMRAKNCMNHSNFKQTRFGECPEL